MSKVIVVTGASRGIGYQTALELANKGHTVIAVARSKNSLQKLAEEIDQGKIIPSAVDLTLEEDLEKLAQTLAEFTTIDGLINNAGAFQKGSIIETDLATYKKLMDVNLFGAIRVIKIAKEKLKKGSQILNISSMSGYQGSLKFGGLSAYGASKAALVGLSEVLSSEFTEDGIAVNCLCIGAVQTEMLAKAFPGFEAPVSAKQMGTYIADFVLTGHQFYNGKVLPVALNDPS